MRLFVAFFAASLASVAFALPQPSPQGVQGADVFGSDAARYGQDSGDINQDLVDELFGGATNGHNNGRNDDGSYTDNEHEQQSVVDNNYKAPAKQVVSTDSSDCAFYKGDGYQCVPWQNCDEYGEIITDGGPGLIDIRGNFGQQVVLDPDNSKCQSSLEVCCRHPDFTGPVTTPKPPPPPKYVSRCGNHNQNGIGVRITNDKYQASTQFGEWPHMCAILEDKDDKNLYVCGGSLIAPDVVLTAAHCVDKYRNSNLKIRCGEWDTQQKIEPAPHQDRYVGHVDVHPGFSARNLSHDMALLHTTEPFVLSAHIDIMCLPNSYDDFAYTGCKATGWGKDRFDGNGQYQVILKQVELNLMGKQQCENSLRQTRLGSFFNLDDSFTCAGGKSDVDTCKGDGGGPLVCPIKDQYGAATNRYMQAGIVAWGIGCGNEGIPGVYGDVVADLCFIDWATRCYKGNDVNYYGMSRCNGWALDELNKIQKAIDAYSCQLNDPYLEKGSRTWKKLDRKVKEHLRARDNFKNSLDQCLDPEQQFTDFAGYARVNADYNAAFCNYAVADSTNGDGSYNDNSNSNNAPYTNTNSQSNSNTYDNTNAQSNTGDNYNTNAQSNTGDNYDNTNAQSNNGYTRSANVDADTKVAEEERR